jgi:hypothetical protein
MGVVRIPFASEAQRRKLWATDPKTAQKIYDDTPKSQRGRKLPYHAKRKARRK